MVVRSPCLASSLGFYTLRSTCLYWEKHESRGTCRILRWPSGKSPWLSNDLPAGYRRPRNKWRVVRSCRCSTQWWWQYIMYFVASVAVPLLQCPFPDFLGRSVNTVHKTISLGPAQHGASICFPLSWLPCQSEILMAPGAHHEARSRKDSPRLYYIAWRWSLVNRSDFERSCAAGPLLTDTLKCREKSQETIFDGLVLVTEGNYVQWWL
jgi:hypothetical protein